MNMNPQAEHFAKEIQQQQQLLAGNELVWLRTIRETSLAHFQILGFPSTHIEDWKYTNVEALSKKCFKMALQSEAVISAENVRALLIQDLACHCLVFINGRYQAQLSQLQTLPDGVVIENLASAIKNHPEHIATQLVCHAREVKSGFTALNSATMNDGVYIHVPKDTKFAVPIHLLFISIATESVSWSQPRNLIVADENAQLMIIETYAGVAEQPSTLNKPAGEQGHYFTNTITEVQVAAHAKVEHIKIQQESRHAFHIGSLFTTVHSDAQFIAHSLSLGGKLVRSDTEVQLAERGAQCELNGLYFAQGKQHIDHHTLIDHAQPQGSSREHYRGIIADQGRAVFNGKVLVRKDAQQTDAHQENHNLLLSLDAEIDTKPQLEIYANDVKCAHGATVGQLDEQAIFYLKSRGIDEQTARNLLIYGFATTIFENVSLEPLRKHLQNALLSCLPAAKQIQELL